MNKTTIVFLLLLTLQPISIIAQDKSNEANTAWRWLEKLCELGQFNDSKQFKENSAFDDGDIIWNQARLLKYRKEGLKFWQQFPNDPRRYQWLFQTVMDGAGGLNPLSYWDFTKDAPYKKLAVERMNYSKSYNWQLQKDLLLSWEKIYPKLRDEFFLYYSRNSQFKRADVGLRSFEIALLEQELFQFLQLSLNQEYRRNNKIDLDKLKKLIDLSGRYLTNENPDKPTQEQKAVFNPLNILTSSYEEFGLSADDMIHFFNEIKKNGCNVLSNWANQQTTLFALRKEPFSFKHTSIDGKIIDLEKMRGKVVLVDFWSTWCSGCIARMPAIKAVYDKYKNQGFDVLSVCIQDEDKLEEIKAVEKKIGADWPILLIGWASNNSLGQQIWRKYGFWSVPQLLLLDKQGKLVLHNNLLLSGDFEPIVRQLLAEK